MIQNVEELGTELRAHPLTELPALRDREIPVTKAGVAEEISRHRAKAAQCGWNHYRVALRVAAKIRERRHHQGSRCFRYASRVAGPGKVRDGSRPRCEVRWIAEEIPALNARAGDTRLACAADVRAGVSRPPGLRAVQSHNRVQLPAFQQLRERFLTGNVIRRSQREVMADVE